MEKIKGYPSYKDSGIEWLSHVPSDWNIGRLKNSVLSCNNGVWGEEQQNDENDINCVRIADFNRYNFEVNDNEFTKRNLEKAKQKQYLLNKGDLLIEKSGGGEKQPVGFVAQYNIDKPAIYANFMARIVLNPKNSLSGYFKYLHSSIYAHRLNVRSIKQTTGIQNLDTNYYFEEIVPYPSLKEQRKIADFLDQKTSEIDNLIADKKRLIELLEEKRQAVITEAVTKGLDPNIELKSVDHSWMKEIPYNWRIGKISYYSEIKTGGTPKKENGSFWENGTINWMNSGEVNKEYIYDVENKITDAGLNSSNARLLPENTVMIALNGQGKTKGKVAILKVQSTCNQSLAGIICNEKKLHYEYLFYFLKVKYKQIRGLVGDNLRDGLSLSLIKSIKVPLPPIDEQREIAEYVKEFDEAINSIIQESNMLVKKLKEYRQSLIYEAVTGKIDVRDYPLERKEEASVY